MTARLAVALHCFSRYCERHNLRHPAIDAFLDDLWEFPIVEHQTWDDWEKHHPALVQTALGDPWPAGFEAFLKAQGTQPDEFRHLLGYVVEIVFSSFYVAADDDSSFGYLSEVLKIAANSGINPPPFEVLSGSRFADRGGWGTQMTTTERNAWRVLKE